MLLASSALLACGTPTVSGPDLSESAEVGSSEASTSETADEKGEGKAITIVNPEAPVRVVGAANSICAPYNPP